MKRVTVLLVTVGLLASAGFAPAVAADDPNFDPDEVEIVSLDGQETDQVNDLEIDISEDIHIELSGVKGFERPLMVEIGGEVVTHLEEPEMDVRPRENSSVTTGEQTLTVIWEDRGDRVVVAETRVNVTDVSLERDDTDGQPLGFDPAAVDIATVNGQDAEQVNEIEVRYDEEISIELDGTAPEDIYAKVELDGTHIGSLTDGSDSFRPREGRDVSEGEQTLSLVREQDDERIVIAKTTVEVTRVALTRDDPTAPAVDPDSVSLRAVNGEDPADVELALRYDENISIALDGMDVSEHGLVVKLDGETIGMIEEREATFRPRTDATVEPGEKTLAIVQRTGGGERTVMAEATVTVTAVELDREADRDRQPTYDPANVSIVAVNGEPADQRNEIRLSRNSPLGIEIAGATVAERGFNVEIDGTVVGILESSDGEVRIRGDSNVSTGDATLAIVWENHGERTVLASTPVTVTSVDLHRPENVENPDELDLEIVSVNGEPADGVVVTEYDLRGETPIELTVEGLSETDHRPAIRYRGEALSPNIDGYEIHGDRITLEHLPRVEDGVTAELELVTRVGAEEFYVHDSVTIEYRHVAEDQAGEGGDGVVSGIMDLFRGGSDGETTTTTADAGPGDGTTAPEGDDAGPDQADHDESAADDDSGGIISTIRELFGF